MRHPEDNELSISWSEVPAYTAIAPTLAALRVLLDTPADLPLIQWQLAPLHTISPQLAGCTWQIVGCLVPVTDDPPAYPFMNHPEDPLTRLQAWLWRTCRSPYPHDVRPRPLPLGWYRPWGELRWHLDRGKWVAMELRPSDNSDVASRVLGWLHATETHAGGRPGGPAAFKSFAEFELTLRQVMAWLEKIYATVPKWRIANAIHRLTQQPRHQRHDPERTLRKIDDDRELEAARKYLSRCGDHFNVNIDVLIARIWDDLHAA